MLGGAAVSAAIRGNMGSAPVRGNAEEVGDLGAANGGTDMAAQDVTDSIAGDTETDGKHLLSETGLNQGNFYGGVHVDKYIVAQGACQVKIKHIRQN